MEPFKTPQAQPARRKFGNYSIGILVALIVFVALAEFLLYFVELSSLVASDPGNFIDSDRLRQAEIPMFVDDPVLGRVPNPEFPGHDANGFRNADIPKQVDILALGDSQTYGAGVHRPQAWPQQLQKISERSIYNMAFGGFGSAHQRILLDRGLPMKPKLVIEAFYFGNDLYDNYDLVYNLGQFPEWLSRDEKTLKTLHPKYKSSGGQSIPAFEDERDTDFSYPSEISKGWMEYSQLIRLFRDVRWGMHWGDDRKEICFSQPMDPGTSHAQPPMSILTPGYRYKALRAGDVRVEEGLRIAQEAFLEMHQQVKDAGSQFMVLLIPTKERIYDPYIPQEFRKTLGSDIYSRMVADEQRAEDKLTEFLKQQGIHYYSPLSPMQDALAWGRPLYPGNSNGHPNATGHEIIATCIAEFIEKTFSEN